MLSLVQSCSTPRTSSRHAMRGGRIRKAVPRSRSQRDICNGKNVFWQLSSFSVSWVDLISTQADMEGSTWIFPSMGSQGLHHALRSSATSRDAEGCVRFRTPQYHSNAVRLERVQRTKEMIKLLEGLSYERKNK